MNLASNAVSKVRLLITSYDRKRLSGYFYSEFYNKYLEFESSIQLLFIMESLLDFLSIPKRFCEPRRFGKKFLFDKSLKSCERMDQNMEKDRILEGMEKTASFIVHVKFRRNSTWQGVIQWIDEGKTQSFRSTLEMIKLIDEALEQSSGGYQIAWDNQ